jgi:hypothetical protein
MALRRAAQVQSGEAVPSTSLSSPVCAGDRSAASFAAAACLGLVELLLGVVERLAWRDMFISLQHLAESSEKRSNHAMAAKLLRAADEVVARFG